ncbi:transmembrane gamma-carboxyglutamic acid protein 3 [Brienomyrus brachyistius]|uniref:transmembrane gamma-carboxyglutamic acid protein 3 n=1 Tax=Brienomyrus brachyistius TaxID=42636 RepID=UPI0020B2F6EB|nr:transmembrane gamma-carboxyglutamic acid protein 3 [Brienomyrus brachyistius]XP_048854063.1 transmembrane gamma-carboxyglutamic acid protein 3 [Brienomyrus brachyistius]XP_048854064.1 transmembrane gamma-carboxyglutamic acid protein 3 [Brienomyrus brachyistius]XP_048854065.1 transmembrane gamma-carboxyglutamic acid protein 3 [Brienomyrus brachyistius]
MEFWKRVSTNTVSTNTETRSERADTVYMVVPLLGVALLIIIALFLIWRCQLQKATRRRPAYTQNRYLASRTSRSLPRILVHRDTAGHSENTHSDCGRATGASAAGGGGGGGTGGGLAPHQQSLPPNGRALYIQDSSASVASRLSGATPPPSYEEVTGHLESSSDETSVPYSDPPPKYEEIVKQK